MGKASAFSNSIRRSGNRRGDRNAVGAAEQNVERRSVEGRHIDSITTAGATTGATTECVADSAFAAEHGRSTDSPGKRLSS